MRDGPSAKVETIGDRNSSTGETDRRPRQISLGMWFSIVPTWTIVACAAVTWAFSALYMWHFGAGWHLDLRVYRAAGSALYHGGSPFDALFTSNRLPFTYPPFALLLLSPLSFGPLGLIEALWWIASAVALVASLSLLLRADNARRFTSSIDEVTTLPMMRALATAAVLGGTASLVLEPVRSNMDYGQINLLLMLLVVADLTRRGSGMRGVLIGLAAAIKLTPLVYLLYFVVRKDWRALGRGVSVFLALTLIGWASLPSYSSQYWLHEAIDAARTGPVGSVSNQSWNGLLNRAPFHGGPYSTVAWAVLITLTVVVGTFVSRKIAGANRPPSEAILALALVELLISPVSWTHHWSWLAITPVAALSLWRTHRRTAYLILWLLAVAIAGPYWWVHRGLVSFPASNALVICGVAVLASWTVDDMNWLKDRQDRFNSVPQTPRGHP